MSRRSVFASWHSASWSRRGLAIEAAAELFRARLLTLMPARFYTQSLGEPCPSTTRQQSGGDHHQAEQIGKIVANVAVRLPFRALCLQQVIAVRRMLARRDFASMIFLGVREENISEAHAWLTVGETVVSGGENLSAFRVLSAFR